MIDLPQKIEGFRDFIASWILKEEDEAIIIDVGPASTINLLDKALKEIGVKDVKYILLTHIHIDHAGGVGDFLSLYPKAKVIVNEKGKKHLINPEKLWNGSLETLGRIALSYGKIRGLKEKNFAEKIESSYDIEIIYTPGHASHHQCFIVEDILFAGESAGVYYDKVFKEDNYYLRPSTPPKFILEKAISSLEKLRNLGRKSICFGHYGMHSNSIEIINTAIKQLESWTNVVREYPGGAKNILLSLDDKFSNYKHLPEDIKKREDFFIENTLAGMREYVERIKS